MTIPPGSQDPKAWHHALSISRLTGSTGKDSLSSALMMLSPANLTGMPGLSIPCGFAGGQPVGMHFLGREFAEADLLGIAHVYEKHTSWHTKVPVRG